MRGLAGDIHDQPATQRDHVPGEFTAGHENAGEIDGECTLAIFQRGIEQGFVDDDPGAIYQDAALQKFD
jgi:hypothetical protein